MGMMSYTVLGIDYYMPNESYAAEIEANVVKDPEPETDPKQNPIPDPSPSPSPSPAPSASPAPRMRHEPQYYAEDIRAGIRRGFYEVSLDYWQRYPLPVMITETGTPYWAYGDLWYQQILLESGALAKTGIPFLGLALYPAVDNFGWDANKAMSRSRAESPEPIPAGVLNLEYEPKPYLEALVTELLTRFSRE